MPQMGWFSRARALHSVKDWKPVTRGLLLILLYLFSENAVAADIQTVLNNVSNIIVPLTAMVLMISYCAGVYFIIHALTMMKKFGNMGMQQTQPGELGGPLMQLVVGAVLIYLPSSTDVLTNSLFSTSASLFGGSSINYANLGVGASVLGYIGADNLSQQWAALANTLVLYIQFIGLLSFIKGWFLMSKSAGAGSQPGNLSKGFVHIIGGIIAINFVSIVSILNSTIFG